MGKAYLFWGGKRWFCGGEWRRADIVLWMCAECGALLGGVAGDDRRVEESFFNSEFAGDRILICGIGFYG